MKYLKEFSEYNPKSIKKVKDFVYMNKYNLPHLWNKELTEDENIDFMIDYFTEFEEEMQTTLTNKIRKATRSGNEPLKDFSPTLQNIGGYSF